MIALIPEHTHALQPANKGSSSTTCPVNQRASAAIPIPAQQRRLLYVGQQLTSQYGREEITMLNPLLHARTRRPQPCRLYTRPDGRRRHCPLNLSRWYSVGLRPHIFRNIRAKCCCVLKPEARAISIIRRFDDTSNSFAYCTLCCSTKWCGLSPIDFLKT
jgi:hypothetical protein